MSTLVTVSEPALNHMASSLKKASQAPLGLRFGLKQRGCSGFEYVLEYCYQALPLDEVMDFKAFRLYVDKEQLAKFLRGTHIDYRREGVNEGLHFENPNVTGGCGCGESVNFEKA